MTNNLTASADITVALAFTPYGVGGPRVSRYYVTAPVATEPRAIRRAGIVPEAANLTEYNEGVYIYDARV